MLTEPEISEMFDKISPTYDRVNRILSLGIDLYWRKKLAARLPQKNAIRILDVATGTGDQIISLLKHKKMIRHIVGIDLAKEMLKIARSKLTKRSDGYKVTLKQASALEIPYPDESFDAVTISFGIRNVKHVPQALAEFYRVLDGGGKVAILEFSLPESKWIRTPYLIYLRHLLPKMGSLLSRNSKAYTYLNETIEEFPSGEAFCKLLQDAGFVKVKAQPLSMGIATLYTGEKDA